MGGYYVRRVAGHPFALKTGYVRVHRLVMEQHLRETNPSSPLLVAVNGVLYLRPDVYVHHINEDKKENDIENLTAIEGNGNHTRLHTVQRWKDGTLRKVVAKLTNEEVATIRETYSKGGISQRAIAASFGIGQSSVNRIVNEKAWKKAGA